jgi:hypothetical protein
MVKEVVLGAEALRYIRGQLEQGHALARALLASIPSMKQVVTFVPDDVPVEALTDFQGGCLGDSRDSLTPAFSVAQRYLRAAAIDRRYLICEHSFATTTDQFLERSRAPFFTHGSDVYIFLASGGVSSDDVHRTFGAGGHYPWIAVLTSLPADRPALRTHSQQSDDIVQTLAQRADHILVGTYDEEGWLISSRAT